MAEQSPMIVLKTGVPAPTAVPILRSITVLGKSPKCDIVLENPFVSRQHARIDLVDGAAVIRDLSSKNGTYVNGLKIGNEPRELSDGAVIEFGQRQVSAEFYLGGRTVTLESLPEARNSQKRSNFVVEQHSRQVWVDGKVLLPALTVKEFDILFLLNSKLGQVCYYLELARAGWPERQGGMVEKTDIRQFVSRIRARLRKNNATDVIIDTVKGLGYRLDVR